MKVYYSSLLILGGFSHSSLREHLKMGEQGVPGEKEFGKARELLSLTLLSLSEGSLMEGEEEWYDISLMSTLAGKIRKENISFFPYGVSPKVVEEAGRVWKQYEKILFSSSTEAWEIIEKCGRHDSFFNQNLSEMVLFDSSRAKEVKNEEKRRALLDFALKARNLI